MVIALTVLAAGTITWTPVVPGVRYAAVKLESRPTSGDGLAHVVAIDPALASLSFGLASEHGGTLRTAREWCDDEHFAVVINAGMYDRDYVTNVGHLRKGAHRNNSKWNPTYQSVLTIAPGRARLWDRDSKEPLDAEAWPLVVQNLRLIKAPGQSVWKQPGDAWSEALVAQDAKGSLLFVFVQTPFDMKSLTGRLLQSELGIVRAMHVEGGPEASLSICTRTLQLHLAGGPRWRRFSADELEQWRIPNVVGVKQP